MSEEVTLHPSAIESFLTCGEQHRLKYLENVRPTVSWDLLIGRAAHFVYHSDAVRFIHDGKFMDEAALREEARLALKMELDNENGNIEGVEPVEMAWVSAHEYLLELIGRYVSDIRSRDDYRPTDTEVAMDARYEFDCGMLHLSARIDTLTGVATGWEFKNKKKTGKIPKNFDGATSLQDNIYLMVLEDATGEKATMNHAIIKSTECRVFPLTLESWQRERTFLILENIMKAKKAGIYMPAAQDASRSWACGYCGVWHECKYTLRRR